MTSARRWTLLLSIALIAFTITALHLYRSGSSLSLSRSQTTQPSGANNAEEDAGKHTNYTAIDADHHSGGGASGTDSEHESGSPTFPEASYSRHIVVAKMSKENASWLETSSLQGATPMVYVPDDPHAPLHVPKNKGHEVMVYLTYLIDHYDNFPDIAIFMHAHQQSWHQGALLQHDAIETVSRLSSNRVLRRGYVSLRCEWNPGCPAWLHPGAVKIDSQKKEEPEMAHVWRELFPGTEVPEVIAQPCCSQFALSKQAMLSVPRARFVRYRDWLLHSKMSDSISGRVFEYLWQYIFTGSPTLCPDMYECYCDGYGICFEDVQEFDYWFKLRYDRQQKIEQLAEWQKQAAAIDNHRQNGVLANVEASELVIPVAGQDVELERDIETMQNTMDQGRLKAIERGKDPAFRAKAAHRPWKEGDGF